MATFKEIKSELPDLIPDRARKGRGAVGNPLGRFDHDEHLLMDDGWGSNDELEPLPTTLSVDTSRKAITYNDSPDIGFDRSINPYRGCEHGCIYCFARPSHAYLGLSPGLDFESRLFHKPDAPEQVLQEINAPNYTPDIVMVGINTDSYQPIERELKLTRRILEVLAAHNHPLCIVTKSALIARDIDILAPMAEKHLAKVCVSVTTLDPDLARKMEPRAAAPYKRLETIKRLSDAGIPVAILAAPMIPAINDHELEGILAAGKEAGAVYASYSLVRLPQELKELFTQWLETHFPDRASRVLSLIKQTRGGKLYDARFGIRRRGLGPVADMLSQRYKQAEKRLGFNEDDWDYDLTKFRKTIGADRQGDLFQISS